MTIVRRLLPWLLAAFFAAGATTVGATFIFVGSLEVAASFDVYGTPTLLAGQPTPVRIWARHFDDPPRPVVDGKVRLTIRNGDGEAVVEAEAELDRTGSAVLRPPVPAESAPGTYTVETELFDGGGASIERASYDVEVAVPADPSSDGDDLSVHSVSEQGEGPLLVELFPRGTHLVSLTDDIAFVRVTERATGAPVADAEVTLELRYGQLAAPEPASVRTDALGLAEFDVQAIGDTDWHLVATGPDGRRGTNDRTLVTIATSLTLDPIDHAFVPGKQVAVNVTAGRDEGVLFVDVFADGVWLEAHQTAWRAQTPRLGWVPKGISPPASPRLATLVACFSPSDCEDVHARTPLVWSAQRLSDDRRLRVLMAAMNAGTHGGWVNHVTARLEAEPAVREDAIERALDFAAGRIPTRYRGAELMLRSERVAQARLDGVRDEVRSWATVLLVVLALAGGLMIAGFAIATQARRRRAMGDVLEDVDHDDGIGADTAALARKEQLAFVIQLVTLAITIGVFVAGVLLLFRQL